MIEHFVFRREHENMIVSYSNSIGDAPINL